MAEQKKGQGNRREKQEFHLWIGGGALECVLALLSESGQTAYQQP